MQSEVEAGMNLLDTYRPGWSNRINLDVLNVSNPTVCPLGQEYPGGYSQGVSSLGIEGRQQYYGFCLHPDFERDFPADCIGTSVLRAYAALALTWKTLIERRRKADAAVSSPEREVALA
jgi:hypothetical protein